MVTIELAQSVPGVSLVKLVERIEEGSELNFAPEKARYLSAIVSGTIKYKYPLRKYSVNLNEDNTAAIVKRSEDLKPISDVKINRSTTN